MSTPYEKKRRLPLSVEMERRTEGMPHNIYEFN
jgi:hypothetical protein